MATSSKGKNQSILRSMKFLSSITPKNEIEHTPYIRNGLSKFKKGEKVTVEVKKLFNKRSLNQNNYYWVCMEIIAKETGHTAEELHRIFKGLFLPKKQVKLKDKIYNLSGSTSDLSKGQFVEYMLYITAEAAQLGISLPSPEQFKQGLDSANLIHE